MMKSKKKPLGLYIHVPFCRKKCYYCDFLSFSAVERKRRAYVETLRQEMEHWREKVSAWEVDTIFIGGGTPSVLSEEEMDVIFQGIYDNFSTAGLQEFTIECNPGTVSGEKFVRYREAGVNRISFGMQSAVDEELEKLGRIHTYAEFLKGFRLARQAGFENINIDMMSAIPGQTKESYEHTLRCVRELAPEHISSYSLIIEEGTPFFEWYADRPPVDEDTDRWMYERTAEVLSRAGYERYEISNYARAGKACRHNLKYWQRKEYLGLGLGAASFLSHTRFSNERDMGRYQEQVQRGQCPAAEVERLSRQEEKAEFMYLGLRCMKGVSRERFRTCFGEDLEICFGEAVRRCKEQGLLGEHAGLIYLTKRGIDVSNRVFEEFI